MIAWENPQTLQLMSFSNFLNRTSAGGNKQRSCANVSPRILARARRKNGSSWAPFTASARRGIRSSLTNCDNARPVRTDRLSIAAPIQNFAHVESSLQLRRHQSNQSYIPDGLIGRFGRLSAGRGGSGELRNAVQP